ncbi:MAG: CinA family protein [Erysipelotrichia bacterium]|nr:CinA family protein [Erysipelotrichia bacterium]NCC55364.1 CinA family protein [Erysipelotrichia bacterium]
MKELVAILRKKQYSIASIESLTAGLFSAKIAEVPHASAVLKGGLVTYMSACKVDVLHIEQTLIDQYGVISKEIAEAMARKGMELFHTDIVVSFTGNAGPDVMDKKAVGLVHMGINFKGSIHTYECHFKGDRNAIREQACEYMSRQLINLLK